MIAITLCQSRYDNLLLYHKASLYSIVLLLPKLAVKGALLLKTSHKCVPFPPSPA